MTQVQTPSAVEPSQAQHEETVVPIKPGLRAARAGTAAPAATSVQVGTRTPIWQYLAGALLIAAVVFVFALFPRLMQPSPDRPAARIRAVAARRAAR